LATLYIGDEAVREHSVEVVNGMFGGLVAAGGCLVAGYLADRMNRRLLYALGGVGTAIAAVAMALSPATAASYDVGCLVYNFFNGICYAAFAAFVLEMIGHGPGVTTKYSLYVGASNFAISYVAALDGFGEHLGERVFRGHAWAKSMGVLGMDALTTFVGLGVLAAMVVYLRRRPLADLDEQRAIAGP
jgi:MFS family permease